MPPHDAPRFSCFVDPEATGYEVVVECKQPGAQQLFAARTLRAYIVTNLCVDALNQRLFALSKRDGAPFFAAQVWPYTQTWPET